MNRTQNGMKWNKTGRKGRIQKTTAQTLVFTERNRMVMETFLSATIGWKVKVSRQHVYWIKAKKIGIMRSSLDKGGV